MATGPAEGSASPNGWLQRAWLAIRRFVAVLMIIRFSLLIPLLLLAILLAADQMSDLLRSLSEDSQRGPLMSLVALSAFAGLTVWYAARTMLRFRFATNPASDPSVHPKLKRLLPRVLGIAMPGLLALRTAWLAIVSPEATALRMLTSVLAAVTLVVALYVCTRRRLASIPALQVLGVAESREARNLTRWVQAPCTTRRVIYALIFANVVALALFTCDWFYDAGIPVRLGAAAILLLGLGLVTVIGSMLVYMANHYAVPVLTLLALWLCLCSLTNDNHLIRTSSDSPSHAIFSSHKAEAPLTRRFDNTDTTSVDSYFDAWWRDLSRDSPGNGPVPVVIVAAEGGGLRAAYWTAGVLARLEDLTAESPLPFSRHVFAISGVSGGAVGAALFDASLANRIQAPAAPENVNVAKSHLEEVARVLGHDFLSDTLGTALFPDLFQRFLPLPLFNDRAIALEKAFERRWRDSHPGAALQLSDPLPSLWQRDPYRVPMLFLNSTVVETGRRAIDTPLPIPMDSSSRETPFADAMLLRNYVGTQIPLSTAALLSARFTYVSPAGLLDTHPPDTPTPAIDRGPRWRRVVDGGYFDNSGAVTAQELVRLAEQVEQRAQQTANPREMKIYVLHLPNAPLVDPDGSKSDASRWEFLSEIFAPVKALLATREARGTQAVSYLRNDGSIEVHDDQPNYVQIKAPLGWALSPDVRESFKIQLTQDHAGACAAAGCPAQDLNAFAVTVVAVQGAAESK